MSGKIKPINPRGISEQWLVKALISQRASRYCQRQVQGASLWNMILFYLSCRGQRREIGDRDGRSTLEGHAEWIITSRAVLVWQKDGAYCKMKMCKILQTKNHLVWNWLKQHLNFHVQWFIRIWTQDILEMAKLGSNIKTGIIRSHDICHMWSKLQALTIWLRPALSEILSLEVNSGNTDFRLQVRDRWACKTITYH